MPYLPGQIIANRYRIVKLLGQGGFGAVYRAWDLNLKIPCALKENLELTPAARRQFEREATWLAGLSHPNLPRVTDHFSEPNPSPGNPPAQYLVMDFIEGQDLGHIVAQNGPVPERQAITWITQVLNALEYLHSQTPPLIHRDVKPANIRIDPEGNTILVDFGLVKRIDPQHGTTTGAMAVSPGYSPTEQYGHGSTDARSDIYSLGATLYKLLTGVEPQESVQRVAQDDIIPIHLLNPQVSLRTSQAVQVAMAMTPGQRFPSATAFKNTLLGSGPAVTLPPVNVQIPPTANLSPSQATTASPQSLSGQSGKSIPFPRLWWIIGGIVLFLCISIPGGYFLVKEFFPGGDAATEEPRAPTRTRSSPDEPAIVTFTPTPGEYQESTSTIIPPLQISKTPTLTLTPTLSTRTYTPTQIPSTVAGFDLAFASDRLGNISIFLMNTLDRTNWINLVLPSGYERAWWPTFCGSYIAGEVADLDGSQPQWIYLVDPVRRSTFLWEPVTAGGGLGVPRCSPNGEYLAYSSGSGSDWDMYIADLDGGSPFLVDDEGIAGYASWLPDNNRMYSMAGSGNPFIIRYATHLLQPSSFSIQTVTNGKYPAVSPDGSQVAYICGDDLRLCLWNVNSGSSTTLHSITYTRVNDQRMPANPAWSVDGQWIYFASADDGDWDIYRIRPSGTGLENMTPDWPTNELMPALQW